ncbi:MAG: hypothetical protein ACI81Y_001077 [Glaciecola sp.]|jgi:hypothetical protein
MGGHSEPQENEILGPVLFAITIAAILVMVIYFWSR